MPSSACCGDRLDLHSFPTRRSSDLLSRREGTRRNTRFIEDAAVRPEQMAEFIRRMRALLKKYDVQAAIFGHAGDCNLHCNPMLNQKRSEEHTSELQSLRHLVCRLLLAAATV